MNKKVITIVAVSLAVVALVSVGIWILTKGKDSDKNGVADKLEPKGLYAVSTAENRGYLLYFKGENICYGASVSLSTSDGQRKVEIRENNWKKYIVSKNDKVLKLEVKNNSDKVEKTFNPVDKSFAESFSGTFGAEEETFVKINDIKQYFKDKYSLNDTELSSVIADWGFWHDYYFGE
jgi:flagellar basal body-associated protein FliL